MLYWILAFYDNDAVHYLKERFSRILRYVYSNYMKPRAVSMLGIVNCNWVSTRENLGVCEHQCADQPEHRQSDQHFCYSLNGKYRTIKYTYLFPITVVASMIDLILSFSSCVDLIKSN